MTPPHGNLICSSNQALQPENSNRSQLLSGLVPKMGV